MSWMFNLRGEVTGRQRLILEILGASMFLTIWIVLTMGENPILANATLPSPFSVLRSYKDLYYDNELVKNTFHSIGLNLAGYILALLLTLPTGFAIGLFPVFRGTFQRLIDAIRFMPLTAVTGLFIVWFGIGTSMKALFLAVGIFIFMLPVVVQRIDEVLDVYLKTVHTLGANMWQTIKTVFIPSVMSRLIDDIRVLTAISWTYIVVAEGIGSQGGLGNILLFAARRQGRIDKMFAVLVLIILIGIIQDRIFVYLDKVFFPHKYQVHNKYGTKSSETTEIVSSIVGFSGKVIVWLLLGSYLILAINEFFPFLGDAKLLSYLFGDTIWAIHFIFFLIVGYKINCWIEERQSSPKIQNANA